MKREEENLTHSKHRALKNQTHIGRGGEKTQNLLCLIFEKDQKDFWGAIHILDN